MQQDREIDSEQNICTERLCRQMPAGSMEAYHVPRELPCPASTLCPVAAQPCRAVGAWQKQRRQPAPPPRRASTTVVAVPPRRRRPERKRHQSANAVLGYQIGGRR